MSHSDLVSELMTIRKDWKIQDFKDAYEDEWDEFPDTIKECHDRMEEYIHHTYDTDYILSLIHI